MAERSIAVSIGIGTALLLAPGAAAQDAAEAPAASAEGGGDLAQQLANPLASLISVPFQFNIDCCFGPADAERYSLNIQPVVPIRLNDRMNLIIRTIIPIIHQESTTPGGEDVGGLGDVVQSFFFSPASGGVTWGVGPVLLYPTGESRLGTEKWGAGPTAVVLKQSKGVTIGALANHIWSFAGDDERDRVSATFLQPFVSKAFPDTTTIGLNLEGTYDWRAEQWTLPANLTASHIYKFGSQPVQIGVGGRYYLTSPDGGPEWGIRLNITLLFPKG